DEGEALVEQGRERTTGMLHVVEQSEFHRAPRGSVAAEEDRGDPRIRTPAAAGQAREGQNADVPRVILAERCFGWSPGHNKPSFAEPTRDASAADLKFLHHLAQARLGTSK